MNTKHNNDPGLNLLDRIAVWLLGPALLPFVLVARQRERQQAEERARRRPDETVEQQEARHLRELAALREVSFEDALYVEPPRAKWVPRGLRCPLGLACERQAECRLWHPEPGFSGRYLPPQAERSER